MNFTVTYVARADRSPTCSFLHSQLWAGHPSLPLLCGPTWLRQAGAVCALSASVPWPC